MTPTTNIKTYQEYVQNGLRRDQLTRFVRRVLEPYEREKARCGLSLGETMTQKIVDQLFAGMALRETLSVDWLHPSLVDLDEKVELYVHYLVDVLSAIEADEMTHKIEQQEFKSQKEEV